MEKCGKRNVGGDNERLNFKGGGTDCERDVRCMRREAIVKRRKRL